MRIFKRVKENDMILQRLRIFKNRFSYLFAFFSILFAFLFSPVSLGAVETTLNELIPFWPADLLSPEGTLDMSSIRVSYGGFDANNSAFSGEVEFEDAKRFTFPGMGDWVIELGKPGQKSKWNGTVYFDGTKFLEVSGIEGAIYLPKGFLIPVDPIKGDSEGRPKVDVTGTISVSMDGNFIIPTLTFPESEIAGTGIILGQTSVSLDLSDKDKVWGSNAPEGIDPANTAWKGIYLENISVTIPLEDKTSASGSNLTVSGQQLAIGNGGITGRICAGSQSSPLSVSLNGFDFTLTKLCIDFINSSIAGTEITGKMKLPFLEKEIEITVDFGLDGKWMVKAKAPAGSTDGLLHVKKSTSDLELDFALTGISFGQDTEGYYVSLDGSVQASIKGLDFNTGKIELGGLKITADGDVKLPGGWYNLSKQKDLSMKGFQFVLRKIGFGIRDDGRRWCGLGGNFGLADVLPVGVSIQEITITWKSENDIDFEIPGIGIDLSIPNTVKIKGKVNWKGDKFQGEVEAGFIQPKFNLKGNLVVGKNSDPSFTYWYVEINAQLPAGIALGSTNVSLYGFSGGFGQNVKLNVKDSWPRHLDDQNPVSQQEGSYVFLAGVTLGTSHDNGFTLNTDVMFRLQIPGPVAVLNGDAWIMTFRKKHKDTPNLQADIIYDGINEIFTLSIRGHYNINKDGHLLKIKGNFEILLSADEWHVYLGQKAADKRVEADILSFIKAKGYLMLGNKVPFARGGTGEGVLVGASIEFRKKYSVKVAGVEVKYWAGTEMDMYWEPKHVAVLIEGGGSLKVWVWKLSSNLTLEASLRGEAPTPFAFGAKVKVSINMPWPVPDAKFTLKLEWEENTGPPSFDHPLKEVTFESPATGKTIRVFDVQDVSTPSTVYEVPLDAVGKITFNRPIDVGDSSVIRDVPSAGDNYKDKVGEYTASYKFTKLELNHFLDDTLTTTEQLDHYGGWGGNFGVPETGWEDERRCETFTFRLARYPVGERPNSGNNNEIEDDCSETVISEVDCEVKWMNLIVCEDQRGNGRILPGYRVANDGTLYKVVDGELQVDGYCWRQETGVLCFEQSGYPILNYEGECCRLEPGGVISCVNENGEGYIMESYIVDEQNNLLRVDDSGELTPVGHCTSDSNGHIICRDNDGQWVFPGEAYITYQRTCTEVEPPQQGTYCPSSRYELNIDTQTDVFRDSTPDDSFLKNISISFETEPLPCRLDPYTAWSYPADGARLIYRDYDLRVYFNADYIDEMFLCPDELELEARLVRSSTEQDEIEPGDIVLNQGNSAAGNADDPDNPIGDYISFNPTGRLSPNSRYFFYIPRINTSCADESGSVIRLYSTSFITSQYEDFGAMLSGVTAVINASNQLYFTTPEPIDWRYVTVLLGNKDITSTRISKDTDLTHIFILAEVPTPGPITQGLFVTFNGNPGNGLPFVTKNSVIVHESKFIPHSIL
ncbi:MAG: hypothetical protein JSV88_02405 [Candidatus Aminicenantes bacterium]|nr:MAG: hypothetical protein JSV88_02405 [Candidatus Aminicenantes bacterium]